MLNRAGSRTPIVGFFNGLRGYGNRGGWEARRKVYLEMPNYLLVRVVGIRAFQNVYYICVPHA
jgi:hypothetical protein